MHSFLILVLEMAEYKPLICRFRLLHKDGKMNNDDHNPPQNTPAFTFDPALYDLDDSNLDLDGNLDMDVLSLSNLQEFGPQNCGDQQ